MRATGRRLVQHARGRAVVQQHLLSISLREATSSAAFRTPPGALAAAFTSTATVRGRPCGEGEGLQLFYEGQSDSESGSLTPWPELRSQVKPLVPDTREFFAEYGEANRYLIREVIGKGSYGIVCSAVDQFTGEKVAIKKITNVFEHVSDATRILREIKLLRMLKHPGASESQRVAALPQPPAVAAAAHSRAVLLPADIVDIKHIMLPPNPSDFKDIYVVFELMETDLHQVSSQHN